MVLHIDTEAYSSEDIRSAGSYKYFEAPDFEILLVAYAFDNEPIKIIDLASGEILPLKFINALQDPNVQKYAHNAAFERRAFKAIGLGTQISNWSCSMVKAAYCGLPLSLGDVSKALALGEKGKLSTGKALIRYFCQPCKPTKANGMRSRNFSGHDPEKWQQFKEYCVNDVEAEREIGSLLSCYQLPESEKANYVLDQEINDRGILVDLEMASKAFNIDTHFSKEISERMIDLTGVENPNSPPQLKKWLSEAMKKDITSLAKDAIQPLIDEAGPGAVSDVLKLRKKLAKSSIKKYTTMLTCACGDDRARGLFQFYGANRTGRWAGRLIQLQNLPQNHLEDLQGARDAIMSGDYDLVTTLYDDISSILSQLIRTAFIAKPKHTFAVADFSAIEARVIAWLAGEKWRMDVFNSHGKIYEASAAMMFNVPIEQVTKGSEYRSKAKVAELALGYQGALGALTQMGGEAMGLSEQEMRVIVKKWREANPKIVALWKEIEDCAKRAIKTKKKVISKHKGHAFDSDGKALTIKLPSGRSLFYIEPSFTQNKFHQESIKYKGMNQTTKQWGDVETYGGKLVENIVQAIARDLLADSMLRLDQAGFKIVMHVHDEAVCEIPASCPGEQLKEMCSIMSEEVSWAPGLPLTADGYVTPFYKKD